MEGGAQVRSESLQELRRRRPMLLREQEVPPPHLATNVSRAKAQRPQPVDVHRPLTGVERSLPPELPRPGLTRALPVVQLSQGVGHMGAGCGEIYLRQQL